VTQFSWAPSLVVLAVGLVGGLLIAWRLRRVRPASTERVDLEIRDLEARRDDLYRRLRDERETLTPTEVEQLEQAAARTLRDLDAASERLPKSAAVQRSPAAGAEAASSEKPATPERSVPPSAGSFITRRPLMSGFLLGAGMIAVVGLLVYWAVRDTSGSMAMSGAADAGTAEVPHQEGDLPPAVQAEYEALQARLAESPDDVAARKRLAVLLLGHEQYFAAFREAQTLLELVPGDIDGLYVDAVVRLQMGQFGDAISGLDQVIFQFPDHVQALAWRGIAHYQLGDVSSAIASWERGIEAAGGVHPELEQMVLAARQEASGEPEAGQTTDSTVPPSPMPSVSPPPLPVATEGSVFLVEIRLAPEVDAAPPGVLFVALRNAPGAPPVAVRRVGTATFPLTVTLTSDDSMMGSPLPDSGFVTVRLDQDGDVTSVADGDLVAASEATSGQTVVVRLAP
jgi:tetratricopeptide (TPR) repeat protein